MSEHKNGRELVAIRTLEARTRTLRMRIRPVRSQTPPVKLMELSHNSTAKTRFEFKANDFVVEPAHSGGGILAIEAQTVERPSPGIFCHPFRKEQVGSTRSHVESPRP